MLTYADAEIIRLLLAATLSASTTARDTTSQSLCWRMLAYADAEILLLPEILLVRERYYFAVSFAVEYI